MLESHLVTFGPLMRGSQQLADEPCGMQLEPHEIMMRVDNMDLFMSGDAESFVVDACSIIPCESNRSVAEYVAFCLLRH